MDFFKKIIVCVLCFLFAAGSCFAEAAAPENCQCAKSPGEDARIIRQNMISVETSAYLPGQVHDLAREYIDSMAEDGSWKDIDYDTVPAALFPAMDHFERLKIMACAYFTPNQPLFESKEIIEAIECGLPAIETKVLKMGGGERQTPGNWWYWNLAIPARIGFILYCVEGKIDERIYQESLTSLKWCLQHPQDWYLKGLSGGASNSIWAIKGNLYYEVLMQNEENIAYVVSEFLDNFKATSGSFEGLTEDDGNRAHLMLDFYGYYSSFVGDTITILNYLDGSAFMPDDKTLEFFANSLCEGASWAMYRGYRDLGLGGRTMSGPFTKGQTAHITEGLKFLANRDGAYKERAQELLNRMASGKEAHTGHKYFYAGDTAIHKTDNSYVSLRMGSSRNTVAESFTGNGMMSIFMGEGSMWILNDPEPLYNSNALACLDWFRLAGTTVVKDQMPYRFRSYFHAAEPFVGGVSDGTGGVSAMNVSQISYPLNAQKSWFFFDDEVVCLGSGIESASENETHTVIDQRVNNGGKILVNGKAVSDALTLEQTCRETKWIANDNVGYYFPESAQVELKKEKRGGSWYMLANTQSADPLTANFSQLYINHGSRAENESYAYAVLPDKSADAVRQYAQGENITILENSKTVQAVHDASTDSTGIVFWPENRAFLSAHLPLNDFFYDGIRPRSISSTILRTIGVTVKGKTGVATADATLGAQGFAVSEQRLSGDVEMEVCWFDDAAAESGSHWSVSYLSSTGVRQTEIVPYKYTDEWVTTKLLLPNAAFSGTGLIEDGIELAIVHSNATVDTNKEKYVLDEDSSMRTIAYSTTLYGPIVNNIKLHPAGKTEAASYSKTAGIVTANEPCIVYYKTIDGGIELSLCEPQQKNIQVSLLLDGDFELVENVAGISCGTEEGKTKLTVATEKGRTYTVTLKRKG